MLNSKQQELCATSGKSGSRGKSDAAVLEFSRAVISDILATEDPGCA